MSMFVNVSVNQRRQAEHDSKTGRTLETETSPNVRRSRENKQRSYFQFVPHIGEFIRKDDATAKARSLGDTTVASFYPYNRRSPSRRSIRACESGMSLALLSAKLRKCGTRAALGGVRARSLARSLAPRNSPLTQSYLVARRS